MVASGIRPWGALFWAISFLWLLVPVHVGDDNWFITTWLLNFGGDLMHIAEDYLFYFTQQMICRD